MSTLGNMVSRIQRELRRANPSADETRTIKDCIGDAIGDFKGDRFGFNVQEFTLSLQQGVYTYTAFVRSDGTTALPGSQVLDVDYARYVRDGSWYHLTPASAVALDSIRTQNQSDGWPESFGWVGDSLKLYPAPSEASTMTLRGLVELDNDNVAGSLFDAASSPDSFTNSWFTDGEKLIRNQALGLLYTYLLDNAARADRHFALAAQERARLLDRYSNKDPRPFVEPCF